ncbi:bifunctional hydroxymethylpyrimidine kinase/phosphomethylpyrimidine kinase [Asaia krungthepensis]|uniref:hydroxymethylpyrimidine kinase n=1 Tax=Asaia krungthepensis NRIC 0535 TaxID=1307925 RepID=A0ABQ0Q627_9PROT|nr:bifunctional hydroxymethylpyrimidine kinase/phosphomethylpyrimidine kinase [Asaia krungthepensis]GBQ93085.1 phosphomethylpyrimidine kinase [Asaia krungthepensis NRIC 0535]
MKGRVLVIAGSDSGGGAGIQADIKTISAFGGFAMTAITAVTAQNTQGVIGIEYLSPGLVADQIRVVLDDLGANIIKLGMLGNAAIMEAVGDTLARYPGIRCVIDPVMVATSGARLMTDDGEAAFARLYRHAFMLTPNLPELTALSGQGVETEGEMEHAATFLRAEHQIEWVLAKGGHLPGDLVVDILTGLEGSLRYQDPRIETLHTHGTGCTLASAIAVGLAQGASVRKAVAQARLFVRQAILQAPPWGKGSARPMNHAPNMKSPS